MTDMTDSEFSADLLRGAKEIGRFLGMKPRTVFYYVEHGRIPVFRFKSQILARKTTLRKWIKDAERRNCKGYRRDQPDDDDDSDGDDNR